MTKYNVLNTTVLLKGDVIKHIGNTKNNPIVQDVLTETEVSYRENFPTAEGVEPCKL